MQALLGPLVGGRLVAQSASLGSVYLGIRYFEVTCDSRAKQDTTSKMRVPRYRRIARDNNRYCWKRHAATDALLELTGDLQIKLIRQLPLSRMESRLGKSWSAARGWSWTWNWGWCGRR
jgi:hypothetical protein